MILQAIKQNKYKIATAALSLIILFLLYRSMVKDFTHEKAMMKIEFRDEKNKMEQDHRAELYEQKAEVKEAIRAKEIQDSMVSVNSYRLDNTIRALQAEKKNYEKYKAIDNLGSDELREYLRKLPKHNDY